MNRFFSVARIPAIVVLLGTFAGDVAAQAPCELPFEAYVTDAVGAPIDGAVDLTVVLYDGPG